jgi:hypothetical protein
LLPVLVALPLFLGFRNADPATYMAGIRIGVHGQIIDLDGGSPVRDGNNGATMQALGYRAAQEMLHGRMPWWNFYSGVGLPLAAEYQPGAFFPLTFLLLLPQGMLLEHLLLQMLAGWGTYALLRQLGLGPLAALTGGLLFAFSGTLALYQNGAAVTLPFLPWMLLGIERAFAKAEEGLSGGWRILAIALTLDLLAGFPESAYINGLMVLAWAVLRLCQTRTERRLDFIWRTVLGGTVGLALAAPQVFVFLQSLPLSFTLFHQGPSLGDSNLAPSQFVSSVIAPYPFGPIYKYAFVYPTSLKVWGGLGGYGTASVLALAAYGAIARRGPHVWLLVGWTVFALAKSFGIQPAVFLLDIVPGVMLTSIGTYGPPTWTLAIVILTAYGLDDLANAKEQRRVALWGAGFVALVVIGASFLLGAHYWNDVRAIPGLRLWMVFSLIWAVLSVLLCATLLAWPLPRWKVRVLAVLLVVESAVMFAIPTLNNPAGGTKLDLSAVDFLRHNLGLNRFYTIGPIWANYSAYYGIASINYNYVPVPLAWTSWEEKHLDGDANSLMVFFRGLHGASGKTLPQQLNANIPMLEWTAVKYVVTAPNELKSQHIAALTKVYGDETMDILQLPSFASYFETVSGSCTIEPSGRLDLVSDCTTPATLLRRELFYPGWTATVNGSDTAITMYGDIFQTVTLPRGRNVIHFHYAPPHIIWMWLTALIGLLVLAGSTFREFGVVERLLSLATRRLS